METGIKSSFIPQGPVVAPSERRRSGSGFDFLMLIALVLFVASATLAVGVFLYEQFLQRSNVSKQEQLRRAEAAFEPALITELGRLDSRMRAADQILEDHVAPTALFKLLEQTTLQSVAFSRFELSATNEGMQLTMEGLAESVNSIALQADLFSKSGVIENPIFSDISRQIGGMHFNVTANVRSDALGYRAHLAAPSPETLPQMPQPLESSPFGIPQEEEEPAVQNAPRPAPATTTTSSSEEATQETP